MDIEIDEPSSAKHEVRILTFLHRGLESSDRTQETPALTEYREFAGLHVVAY